MNAIVSKQGPASAGGVDSQVQVTVHVGVFFDGTGNNRLNCLYTGTATSNIARLYELYCDQASERLAPGQTKLSLGIYVEGIGTYTGAKDSVLSTLTGGFGAGVVARAQRAATAVVEHIGRWSQINPQACIAHIEVDIFGFSRGAAAARHFANDLDKGPASHLAHAWPAARAALAEGFDWQSSSCLAINFIGLFDTVAAIVSPVDGDFSPANDINPGVELGLRPDIGTKVVHLVARDEHRKNFPLTQAHEDIVMPGAHADLGGGYLPVVHEQLVLSRPISSIEPYALADERSQAYLQTHADYLRHQALWQQLQLSTELCIQATPLPVGDSGDEGRQKQVVTYVRGDRQVEGDLALVYLRVMHALAVAHQVPFAGLDQACFTLPPALQAIAGKLLAYAAGAQSDPGLSGEEQALLRERFIHLSSDWSVGGSPRVGFELMYFNRPHESGQRDVFANR